MQTTPLMQHRQRMRSHYLADEAEALKNLEEILALEPEQRTAISQAAVRLVNAVRNDAAPGMMEAFLGEYGLSTQEGVALMCLAEALLRVPDSETIDDLIRDKIVPHDWSAHSGQSGSIMVNASTWALMLTGRVLDEGDTGIEMVLRGMVRRLGEPVIRTAVSRSMREMGEQFVLGQTIVEALQRGKPMTDQGYFYSFDMLGEAARTAGDAERYFNAYREAILALADNAVATDIRDNPGISVKLSALHPRYEAPQRDHMLPQLGSRLLELAQAAKASHMGLNIDAEEADRLDLSLDVIEQVLGDPSLAGWDGFGVVVQAYGPRAPFVLDWLHELACRLDRKIMVRLVKGAYWDTEVKRAQVMGLDGFPVFTRKVNTDLSYLACSRKLLAMTDRIYPQFATHNAHTAAAVLAMAPDKSCFEFQRLHGMGEALHEALRQTEGTRCRIYAPVGAHSDLLAYLVRRLLENGANSSFVHQIVDLSVSAEEIAADPVAEALGSVDAANPMITPPAEIFGRNRRNARGWDVTDVDCLQRIDAGRGSFAAPHRWMAAPMTKAGGNGPAREVFNPASVADVVGEVVESTAEQVRDAVKRAAAAQPDWAAVAVVERAEKLNAIADLYEAHAEEFFALATREAGKSVLDGIAEVREAVDFLRYYAGQAEACETATSARGVVACISPWNFPLAIFTGQISAALVTGNAVIAKPAEQTALIAVRAVELMLQAGIPQDIIQLLPGDGPAVGGPLVADPDIAGVCFTGSTEVARVIERQLAQSAAPDAMLIAETGGLNAMIVDSTALPEQAVRDIVASAFQSAGQRCSALRVLYVQKDVEERFTEMLVGAMRALSIGDPWDISTDVGPVIDDEARQSIQDYCDQMEENGALIAKLEAPQGGRFVAPHIFKVSGIEALEREIFGPVLHVATYEADEIDGVIDAINARGYGLTFGLHTRIDARVQHMVDRVHAGNVYVNRNQIGAVVGSQPFGGEGLSGTGPKAGGPHYLRRFRKTVQAPSEPVDRELVPVTGFKAAFLALQANEWALREDRLSALRRLLRGRAAEAVAAAARLDPGPTDLPGPTGEANTLRLVPRGRVLCLGPDEETLLAQVVQALCAGNAVLAVAPNARKALSMLRAGSVPLAVLDGVADPAGLGEIEVDVVAVSGDTSRQQEVRRSLASGSGPIVPLVTEVVCPQAYVHERAVCVDTTAAGGNASLLASAG